LSVREIVRFLTISRLILSITRCPFAKLSKKIHQFQTNRRGNCLGSGQIRSNVREIIIG
jgi:hypothetical protein